MKQYLNEELQRIVADHQPRDISAKRGTPMSVRDAERREKLGVKECERKREGKMKKEIY